MNLWRYTDTTYSYTLHYITIIVSCVQVQPVVSPAVEGPPGVETPPLTEEKIVIGPGDAPPGVDSPPSKILLIKQGQAITSVGSAVNHHRVSNHMSQSKCNIW